LVSTSNAQVAEFLKLFSARPTQKVFVHCYFGRDRTGVMVAAYRMSQQNWTADQAVEEMYSFGFHSHWYPAMKSYVRKFRPLSPATIPLRHSNRSLRAALTPLGLASTRVLPFRNFRFIPSTVNTSILYPSE